MKIETNYNFNVYVGTGAELDDKYDFSVPTKAYGFKHRVAPVRKISLAFKHISKYEIY